MKTLFKFKKPKYIKKRKTQYKLKSKQYRKYLIQLVLIIIFLTGLYFVLPESITINTEIKEEQKEQIENIVRNTMQEEQEKIKQKEEKEKEKEETTEVEKQETTSRSSLNTRQETTEVTKEDKSLTGYRITSYYAGDGYGTNNRTGSGKTTADFSTITISGKKVYTYQGKIVIAAATYELLNTGYSVNGAQTQQTKHYFHYYDTGKINIDGTFYDFIVLDSCGASMWLGYYRFDIMVPSNSDTINRYNVTAYYN